jgi:hypothetical protein
MVFMTLGFGLFYDLDSYSNWAKIIIYEIVAGVGVGPNFQAPLISLQSAVDRRDIGSATSTFQFIRQLATSISIVVGAVVFQNEMQKQYPTLLKELGPELASELSGGSAGASITLVRSLTGQEGDIARGAYFTSLRPMYIMYTAFAGLGLIISPFVGQRRLSKEHEDHKTGLQSLQPGGARKEVPEEKQTTTESS